MSRYIKSYSNYTLKKQHQFVKNGTIFERDWVTIGGTNQFTPGQSPVYSNGNFIFTINNTPSYQKKHKYGHWVKTPDGDDLWVDDDVKDVNLPDTNSEVEINEVSNDLRDFAYFGSCVELIRASVEDIIKYFPAELYFSGKIAQIVTGGTEDINPFKTIEGFVVDNEFNINLINNNVQLTEYENDLRYFSYSYRDYEIVIGSSLVGIPITSVTIVNEDVDVNCLEEGDLLNIITINGNLVIKGIFANGERRFFHNGTIGLHIRPIKSRIDKYFKNLDGFEKILLNRKSTPIYTNTFLTPIESDKGLTFINRNYSWSVVNGWNLDISSPNYLSFFGDLISMAQILDENYCDNIYRSMTHEAIKNFDWTYTREYNDGDEQEYVIAGTRIINLLRIYGRMLDDIKRYIDGIKFTNTITYNRKNNISDYFLSDKLELNGWDVSTVIKNGTENDVTDILYSGESTGYTYSDINNQFMRRLALCSKAIFKSKGTKHSIEMLLGMFGIDKCWYSINEYHYTCSPITNQNTISLIQNINEDKNIVLTNDNDSYSGLLVKELKDSNDNIYLIPWFDKNTLYDGNPYFQSDGGWGSENPLPLNNNNFVYNETMPYINVVATLDELLDLEIVRIMPNDVYYVYDISDIKQYNFTYDNPSLSGNPTNYFILGYGDKTSDENIIINNSRNSTGWTCVTYEVVGRDKIITNEKVVYLESIISKNNGNNPHIGYGNYDMGREFFEYLSELFKYSIENNKIDGADMIEAKGLGFTDIDFNYPTLDPIKIQNIDVYKNICGVNSVKNNTIPSKIFLNTKLLVIENKARCPKDKTDKECEKYPLDKNCPKDFEKYFIDFVVPYIEQLIPSTAIFGLKGFDSNEGSYLTLSTNEVKLNDSMNTIDSKYITLNASNNWKSSPESSLTDGIPLSGSEGNDSFTVKKKNEDEKKYGTESITFSLNDDNTITSVLNVTVSQISSSDIIFDVPTGGEKTVKVIVNGESNNQNYYIEKNVSWANVTKNGNEITVVATENNSSGQRYGTITVYNSNDSNCYWIISVAQVGALLSITTPPNIEDVPYNGGIYYIDVTVTGGRQDFTYNFISVPTGFEKYINAEKISPKLLKLTIYENQDIVDIDYTFTFYHASDKSKTSTTSFKLLKASGLGILINGKNENGTCTVGYEGGVTTPSFTVEAIGASKTWNFDNTTPPTPPEWLTITKDVNNLLIIAKKSLLIDSREYQITVYHNDDKLIKKYINVKQNGVGDYGISTNKDEITYNSNGGSTVVVVNVSGGTKNYSITNECNWITTQNNIVGDYGDYKEYKLVVNIAPNKDVQDRNCSLLLIHNDDTTKTETILIKQSAATTYDIYATKIGETTPVTIINDVPFTRTTEENGYKFDIYTSPTNAGYIVNENSSWIYTSTNGNVLTVWFDSNNSPTERSSEVILKNMLDTSKTHTIIFTQLGAGLLFIGGKLPDETNYSSNLSIEFDATDNVKYIDIKVDGGMSEYILNAENANKYKWIHVSPPSGKTGKISISCDENTEDNNRNGIVILTHKDNTDYSFMLNVKQNQGFGLLIEPNDGGTSVNESTVKDVVQSGIIKTFSISASGGEAKYRFVGDNIDWVTANGNPLTSLSGTSDTVLKLQILPNNTGVVRNAIVTFEHVNDSTKKVFIKVNQLIVVYDILIDGLKEIKWNEIESSQIERIFTISVSGGSMQYIVDEPIECTYDAINDTYTELLTEASWVNPMSQGNTLTLALNENGISDARAAKVSVRHSDKPDEIHAEIYLWQKGATVEYKNYIITLTPTEVSFNDEGGTSKINVVSTRDKFVNGNFIKKEDVPYKIKIEEDTPITYTNIFKVYGNDSNQEINLEAPSEIKEMAVVSLLRNDVTGSENAIVWKVTSDSNWLIITYVDSNRTTISILENITNSKRNGKLTFVQDKEDGKTIILTFNQNHYPKNVIWSDPAENTTKSVESGSTTFIAYANTTALTYNDIIVNKSPDETWVSVSAPTQGDNEYGVKSVKVEIIVNENNDANREMAITIDKK